MPTAVPHVEPDGRTLTAPRGSVILRKRLSEAVTRSGSIIIPDNARFRDHVADVVSVGDGVTDIRVGDAVIVADWADAGRKFRWGDETLSVVRENDLLGVVE